MNMSSSCLVNFISELFSKIELIAISIASDNGIFVNKLVTSIEIKNLRATFISSINVKLSFVEYSGQSFPQVLRTWGGSLKFDGGLKSVHGGVWGA